MPKIPLCVPGVLVVHGVLLAYSAAVHSPTLNEPAHLLAGLSHWQCERFELFRANPPLVRMIAALPVVAAGHESQWRGFYDGPGARPVFAMASQWCVEHGPRVFSLVTMSRWACIPISLLGGVVCFLWSRDLFGTRAGVLAVCLWAFSPNILAHASLITNDAHAAAFGCAAIYMLWKWLRHPTWHWTWIAGVTLGLAGLSKTTLCVLYPLVPVMWLAFRVGKGHSAYSWLRNASMLAMVITTAIAVMNLGYGWQKVGTRLGDFAFVSSKFTGPANDNRFSGSLLAHVPVPLPADYVRGIDVQLHDMESGRESYLCGTHANHGWWFYYLVGGAVKVPIGTLLVGAIALLGRATMKKRWNIRNDLVLLAPPFAIVTVVSSHTEYNEHVRYILPALPFLVVWCSQAVTRVGRTTCIAGICVVGSAASSLWTYPHSVSYFNEVTGGPRKGHDYLIHSNIDWGQDLLYLRQWMSDNPHARPLYLSYFGPLDPARFGFEEARPLFEASSLRDPARVAPVTPGWYAISVNYLRQHGLAAGGGGRDVGGWSSTLSAFQSLKPAATAGYSIYIFHLDQIDCTTLNERVIQARAARQNHRGTDAQAQQLGT